MTDCPKYPATTNREAIDLNIHNSNKLHIIVNGSITDTIATCEGNGDIPSVQRALHQAAAYKVPTAWSEGDTENDLLQPRILNNYVYVPLTVPAPMVEADLEDNWRLYTISGFFQSVSVESHDLTIGQTEVPVDFGYVPNTSTLFVYRNGVLLKSVQDFEETDSTKITLVDAVVADDQIMYVKFANKDIGTADASNVSYSSGSVADELARLEDDKLNKSEGLVTVDTLAELKGLASSSLTDGEPRMLLSNATTNDGGEAKAVWLSGDYSGSVGTDSTLVTANDNPSGSQGVWKLLPPVAKRFEVLDLNYEEVFRLESDYSGVTNTVWLFLQTGQSLAEGGVGGDVVSGISPPVLPDQSLMLSGGPIGRMTNTLGSNIVPLDEEPGSRITIGSSYMRGVIANQSANFETVFHGQAWGGATYDEIKKGGANGTYEDCLTQVANVFARKGNGVYKGLSIIHGEADGLINNPDYATDLREWVDDFNTDIKAVTGQVADIPLLFCQTASAGGYGRNGGITDTNFQTPLQQLQAHEDNADMYLVGSKYFLPYYDQSHITNAGQVLWGDYYAKAFNEIESSGTWNPLRPVSITAPSGGTVITITVTGRTGNLVIDTTNVQSIANNGFDYVDDSGRSISSVTINGSNQIEITLDGAIGANPKLSYAYHNGSGGASNQAAGLGDRGNIRDSDTAVGAQTGETLYNWLVIFKKDVVVS